MDFAPSLTISVALIPTGLLAVLFTKESGSSNAFIYFNKIGFDSTAQKLLSSFTLKILKIFCRL